MAEELSPRIRGTTLCESAGSDAVWNDQSAFAISTVEPACENVALGGSQLDLMCTEDKASGRWTAWRMEDTGRLLIAASPHLLRCRRALDDAALAEHTPFLLLLQVTPQAEWIVAGAVTDASRFDHKIRARLEHCCPERRAALLRQWCGHSAPMLPVKPDTLEWSGTECEGLFSADVSYLYNRGFDDPSAVPYPALRADSASKSEKLKADVGLSWRRTVWTDDFELTRLLAGCEHPAVRLTSIHGEFHGTAEPDREPSEAHTHFLNAFRYGGFFLDLTGPPDNAPLWRFTESTFGSIFGIESCFCTRAARRGSVCVRVASPSLPDVIQWQVEAGGDGFYVFDGKCTHAGRPDYFRSRRDFVAWAFNRFR